ncbi:hypothetical protein J2W51_002290 [Tardiphaga robiniae]|nr:hypothetical protein [Tardiphaga robiniae]
MRASIGVEFYYEAAGEFRCEEPPKTPRPIAFDGRCSNHQEQMSLR